MENRASGIGVAVAAGALAGMTLLVGITFAVQTATAPLQASLREIAATQKSIELKLSTLNTGAQPVSGDQGALLAKLTSLENSLKDMKQRQNPPQPPPEDYTTVHNIPVGSSAVAGAKDGQAIITVFTDIQCPFCSRFHAPIKDVLKAYPNDVRFVVKNYPLPFHPNARGAAKAALAAGLQGKYFEMIDELYANQQALGDDKYKELAGKVGLNVEQFLKDLKDKDADFEKTLQADTELAGNVGVRGTPTFFLNGRLTSARDLTQWKAEIEKALKEKANKAADAAVQAKK
ncbi:MAG: thioredoxin domain-containing protein [Candidatus Omnitrophica bacterium]|nr:thioredoxin domain-containing protein [Candidatus Omnitrophota bacterium]